VVALAALSLSALSSHAADLNTRDMVLLDRLTWGIKCLECRASAGGRHRALARRTIAPGFSAALPDAVRTQIEANAGCAQLPFDILVAFDQQAKSANQVADPDSRRRRHSRSTSRP